MVALLVERIRSLTEDAAALLQEYYETVAVVVRDDPGAMQEVLREERSGMWMAYAGGAPAGCVVLKGGVPIECSGEVKRLYVRPAYRRKGIADVLMDALEGFAREQGLSWAYLDTNDAFKASVELYKRRGYIPCSRYNANPQARMFFRKPLS